MDFDASTNTFSNLKLLATVPGSHTGAERRRPWLPCSFFPTNDAVAFHYQTASNGHQYNTWQGAQAQIWWSDLATGTAAPLSTPSTAWSRTGDGGIAVLLADEPESRNGGSYSFPDDTVLNYEPTVNPIASGGYMWVIFTSRRLYGSVATTPPWQSDPRGYDYTQLGNATCKKLWVVGIDLNAKPGTGPRATRPSTCPRKELLAGNSRGFWVLPPCKSNGQTCQSGDECCNGYCEPGPDAGLICTNKPPNATCSQPQEKCQMTSDCCDTSNTCINGFCTVSGPQ